MKYTLLALLILVLAVPAKMTAADSVEMDVSPTLFSVLTAINVAGYDAELQSASNSRVRASVRQYFADKPLPTIARLREFYKAHKKPDATADLSQYISFALSVKGAPDFTYRFKEQELPPDVEKLDGFGPLMADFYQEANLAGLWDKVQPEYERWLGAYQTSVTQAIFEVNGYLRNPTSGYLGRRFVVYVDLMGAPNQIQARSYGDDYFLVLTSSPEPQTSDVRHAYLHYLLDPLSLKYAQGVLTKQGLRDYAQGAPALDISYKNDFLLLETESLIKAVEARMTRGAEKKQQMVTEALREGFVVTPAFYELLPAYEAQPSSMQLYYRDLIEGINLGKEEKRLANVEFADTRKIRRANHLPSATAPATPQTAAAKMLQEADDEMYVSKNYDRSQKLYLQLLSQTEDRSVHGRAYYGLGRIALLQRRPGDAEKLLEHSVELKPDPTTLAWAHVYLGRLAKASTADDGPAVAKKHFEAALAVEGIPADAKKIAEQGLQAAQPH